MYPESYFGKRVIVDWDELRVVSMFTIIILVIWTNGELEKCMFYAVRVARHDGSEEGDSESGCVFYNSRLFARVLIVNTRCLVDNRPDVFCVLNCGFLLIKHVKQRH